MLDYQVESAAKLAAIRTRLGPDVTEAEMLGLIAYFKNFRSNHVLRQPIDKAAERVSGSLIATSRGNPQERDAARVEAAE